MQGQWLRERKKQSTEKDKEIEKERNGVKKKENKEKQ